MIHVILTVYYSAKQTALSFDGAVCCLWKETFSSLRRWKVLEVDCLSWLNCFTLFNVRLFFCIYFFSSLTPLRSIRDDNCPVDIYRRPTLSVRIHILPATVRNFQHPSYWKPDHFYNLYRRVIDKEWICHSCQRQVNRTKWACLRWQGIWFSSLLPARIIEMFGRTCLAFDWCRTSQWLIELNSLRIFYILIRFIAVDLLSRTQKVP